MSGDTWLWDFRGERLIGRPWRSGRDRRAGLPALVHADGPRGVGLGASTCFPVPMARGASWDRALERRIGEAAAAELRAQGGRMWLAPTVNLLRHPLWGRAQETYGEDPFLVGEMGAALVEGAQSQNVLATVKHFALNSIEETRMAVDVRTDERTLREVYLPQFKRVVDAGVAVVMSAYNQVNGDYAAESRHLLRDILKDEWGFRGFVVSDWFTGVHDGIKAADAGLDLEMPLVRVFGRKLLAAISRGEVKPEVVDEAVLRILRRRIEFETRPDPRAYDASVVGAPAHVRLAREAAEKGIVLLKNAGPILPLNRAATKTLVVLGPLATAENIGDRGSSRVYSTKVVTPLDGLRAHLGNLAQVAYDPGTDLAKARALASGADAVIVVVGFTYRDEGESLPGAFIDASERGGDRAQLGLESADRALIEAAAAANPRTIVVLNGGAAITVEDWKDRVPAILMAFYPGEQGGTALARLLFGDVNPSGKLPFTVPVDAAQLPSFDNVSLRVEYGYYHGYTLLEKSAQEPAYPFGYGLSYTRYAYANLALDPPVVQADGEIRASVDVTNTGTRQGEEIVQLYVGFGQSQVDRPVKLLRGFERVALEPGETRRVTIPFEARDLAYYDPDARRWVVERMEYRVLVGPSARASDLLGATMTVVD
ncbi:MAG TPA: glycoside hydrolase family 3 C-terminal domain-containing protein [Thermoanaerobaculia bacterium]|nr:glycoside hydrolase family 3 C-terminal domain-containing protein [Thermoanaerobaculia bacterium]